MKAIISGLGSNWHFMRIVRLLFALALLVSFYSGGDKIALFGAVFLGYQAIFNVGCCGQACYSPISQTGKQTSEVEYEEIKNP